ncbi:serine protease [Luteimonas sp. MC1782]|uniref:PA domain-containing protein n=1 Tax=Luteimonas sp. MC1782 TaxID=2760305 RepID=UPI0016023767|nr:PA domain-containing protein [Luteimonas sp. MC1782]MBB1473411.1 serine protease [Luteimonas sp. MC1782]
MNKTLLACALAVASVAAIGTAQAATIIPVNMNAAGVGLNDPTPAVPVGNNPGKTVGEQRQIVYQFAADLWGAVLESDVDIRVRAQFTPLACEAASGVLGSAGARFIQRDFEGAVPATWYGEALANAIAGENLSPTEDEINSNFNSNLGTPGCLENSGWYYGLDGNTPAGRINFLDVVMHEIGHGLNFQGFHNLTTGAPQSGFTDIYSSFVYDNATSKAWNAMTNAERAAAAKSDALVWTGDEVTSQVPDALGPLVRLFVSGGLTAQYDYGTASFGATATPANFNGQIVLVGDGSANPTQGCVASPAGAYAGKVALVDRGTCAFEIKANHAQNAGAIAVIVANNVEAIAGMAEDPSVNATVPTIMVALSAGNAIKAVLPNANAALQAVPGSFAGSDTQGRARLYSPAVLATGSTFSHFDVSHAPNALMEPSINQDLDGNLRLDLTPALYSDMGWTLNQGNAATRNGRCDTGVPVFDADVIGLVGGANLQAAAAMCSSTIKNKAGLASCLAPFVAKLRSVGAIPASAEASLRKCSL